MKEEFVTKAFFVILTATLFCMGCAATASKMNNVSVGMTKSQVIEVLGTPASTSAKDGVEYLNYRLSETSDDAFMGYTKPFFVRLIRGKVEAYGRLGDFDSANIPENKTTIDIKMNK
jgi:hypothetical protein